MTSSDSKASGSNAKAQIELHKELAPRYAYRYSFEFSRLFQQDWHAETRRPLHGGRVGRWQKELSAQEVRAFEDVAGPLLRRLGYETVDPVGITALLRRLRWGRKGDRKREHTAKG